MGVCAHAYVYDILYWTRSIEDNVYFLTMGRKRIHDEETLARFPAGTLERVDAALRADEKRAEFFREAVERELKRRESSGARKARP
jgi:hypothetical protein